MTGRLVALLAFCVGVGANFVNECFRRVPASAGDTRKYCNCQRCSDRTIAKVALSSKSTWHVRIVSCTSLLVQASIVLTATPGGTPGLTLDARGAELLDNGIQI
jgi:hypothetical protein